jgi:exosome complex component RRP41
VSLMMNLNLRKNMLFCGVRMDFAGTRAACINAASMALADAGIPMRDLVVSCAAGYLNSTPLLGISVSHIPRHQ